MARVQYLNDEPDWVDTIFTGLSFPRKGFIQEDVEDAVAKKMALHHPDVYRVVPEDFVEEAPAADAGEGEAVTIDESIRIPDGDGGEVALHNATIGQLTHHIQTQWPHVNIADQSDATREDLQVFVTKYAAMAPAQD